jgi:uncharacterized glyoxalase superfamily protein PhnB
MMSDSQTTRQQSEAASEQTVNYLGAAPYLYYADATEALEWLVRVFGFAEKVRYVDAGGAVFQAVATAGDAQFYLACVGAEHWQAKGVEGPVGQLNIVYVDDVDLLHRQIVERLAEQPVLPWEIEVPEPQNQPYGARVFTVSDPGGNTWTFWQQVSDVVELPHGWREIRESGGNVSKADVPDANVAEVNVPEETPADS